MMTGIDSNMFDNCIEKYCAFTDDPFIPVVWYSDGFWSLLDDWDEVEFAHRGNDYKIVEYDSDVHCE